MNLLKVYHWSKIGGGVGAAAYSLKKEGKNTVVRFNIVGAKKMMRGRYLSNNVCQLLAAQETMPSFVVPKNASYLRGSVPIYIEKFHWDS